MALLLHEADVERYLPMADAVAAVEAAFRHLGSGEAQNIPRARTRLPTGQMHVMAAADPALGYLGLKAYTTIGGRARFVVLLFSTQTGELLAVMEADTLGQRRTGAASGVATRYMARSDAQTVGVYGTGWQARSQVAAIAAVRDIRQIRAYSRNTEHREAFARGVREGLGIEVVPVDQPHLAAEGADILITITSAREPVLRGEWLTPGVHINAAGSNALVRRELDEAAVQRCDRIVVDAVDQARLEAGDLLPLIERGTLHWGQVHGLGEVVTGAYPGRVSDREMTLFKSLGLAVEDIAAAGVVYERALADGAGQRIAMFE
ncbi:MAG: ornithine cyclodeaminase family protein [Anaerolineae bacterium]|nr:ornithine cyclodeaminase family protein [Anaerolineae bacterium]